MYDILYIADELIEQLPGDEEACTPRLESVSTLPANDPSVLMWPPCTKALRCGGCSGHEMFECVPSKIEMKDTYVSVFHGIK